MGKRKRRRKLEDASGTAVASVSCARPTAVTFAHAHTLALAN